MATSRFEHPSAAPVALLLPDLDCGRGDYWLDRWAAGRIDCRAIDLGHAHVPDRNDCVSRLDRACRGVDAPLILIGHGVGALTIAAWAGLMTSESEHAVAGALLIGPSDPAAEGADPRLASFAPVPNMIFTFPALVVASADDPTIGEDRAFSLARQWGAGFASFGRLGHFRPCDDLGAWREGEHLLDRFIDLVEPGHHHAVDQLDRCVTQPAAFLDRGTSTFAFRPR